MKAKETPVTERYYVEDSWAKSTVTICARDEDQVVAECYVPDVAQRIARLLNADEAAQQPGADPAKKIRQLEKSLEKKIAQVLAIRTTLEEAGVGGITLDDGVRFLVAKRDEYRAWLERPGTIPEGITKVARAAVRWRKARRRVDGRASHEDVAELDAAVDDLSAEELRAVGAR